MKIIEKKLDELIPYENNPRNNDAAVDAVAASLQEFGWKQPLVIDKNNVIVAGHTRLKAAQKLCMISAPCIMADDLTEEQIKAYRLADNKTAELAEWNQELLLPELEGITGIDMSAFGFELPEALPEITEDEFDEELPEEPKTQPGDLYLLGNHRLLCADSTDAENVKICMGGYY